MTVQEIVDEKKISVYRLSKMSGIPYATLNDIVSGKAQLEKCSAETIYKLSHALDVPMEKLLAPCFAKRSDFENFKSAVCHRVKLMGDVEFIIETLEKREIRDYYEKKWYPECLYLLAMLDYVSRVNGVPICNEYDDIRKVKLKEAVYPASILAISAAAKNNEALEEAKRKAIPEFKRFNIIENEVRNVV